MRRSLIVWVSGWEVSSFEMEATGQSQVSIEGTEDRGLVPQNAQEYKLEWYS